MYKNASSLIEGITKSNIIKRDDNVYNLFNTIWQNTKTARDSWIMADAAKSDAVMKETWRGLKRNMLTMTTSKLQEEYMRIFFDNMPEEVVQQKGYEHFYEACMESFVSPKQQKVYEWEEKQHYLKGRGAHLAKKAKQLNVELTEESIYKATDKIYQEIDNLEAVAEIEQKEGQVFSNQVKSDLKSLRKKAMELAEFQTEFLQLKEETKQLQKEMGPGTLQDTIMDKASMYYSQIDCKKGLHINSKEFKRMSEALRVVKLWGTDEINEGLKKYKNPPKTIEEALELLKTEAAHYLDAKAKQNREYESALRKTRLAFAKSIVKFADESLEKMQLLPSKEAAVEQSGKEAAAQNISDKDVNMMIV